MEMEKCVYVLMCFFEISKALSADRTLIPPTLRPPLFTTSNEVSLTPLPCVPLLSYLGRRAMTTVTQIFESLGGALGAKSLFRG